MADDFYRINSADEDKKLAASQAGGRYFLQHVSPSFAVRADAVDANTMYIGYSIPGVLTSEPFWQIRKLVTDSGGNLLLTYADASATFEKVWNDRASYTY